MSVSSTLLTLDHLVSSNLPYAHFIAPQCFEQGLAMSLLEWFDEEAAWKIHRVPDFYEVYDLDLIATPFPAKLSIMREKTLYIEVRNALESHFKTNLSESVHVLIQKMTKAQSIRVHNDWSPEGPTHRFIVHLNPGWEPGHGGEFVVMQKPDGLPLATCLPDHRSGIGFEISERSYHAVRPVIAGNRYSVVFSYRAEPLSRANR